MQITKTHYEVVVIENGKRIGAPILPYDLLFEATEHAERIVREKGLPIIELTGNERIADLGEISAIIVDVIVERSTDDGRYHRIYEAPRQVPSYPFRETRLPPAG